MTQQTDRDRLQGLLSGALDLITQQGVRQGRAVAPAPLESLLDQCRAMHRQALAEQERPIRLLHHFACTGGTILSKCIAALPNVVLLSEIDPLSTNQSSTFAPSDLIRQLRQSRHPLPQDLAIEIFLAGLAPLQTSLKGSGRHLVLRDHSHSHFCTEADWTTRPSLREIVARRHRVVSAVSVRHPIASYLSLLNNRWVQFEPATLDEYARRYLAFLEMHAAHPVFRYEDFTADPEPVLADLCRALELPYAPGTPLLLSAIRMSGDSGRSGDVIAPRPDRIPPAALRDEAAASPAYIALCDRLGYPPLEDLDAQDA